MVSPLNAGIIGKVVINPIPLLLLNQFILDVPFTAVSFTIFKFSYCRRSMYYCDNRTIDTILHLMAYNSCKQKLLHLVTITYQVPSRTNKALTRTATATGSGVTRNMSDKVGRRSHSLRCLSEYIPKLSAFCRFSKKEIFWFCTLFAGRRSRRYQEMKIFISYAAFKSR